MKGTRRQRKLMAEINVVPYIDVMLVLLIIFMITAPLITQGVKVDLPQIISEVVPPDQKEPVIVSVDKQGEIYINYGDERGKPIDTQGLIKRVSTLLKHQPQTQFLIESDNSVPYGRVVKLMAVLQGAGVPSVGLITEPPPEQ